MPPTTRSLAAGPCTGPLHPVRRSRPVLRIAVPNKGVLSEPAAEMLAESGYRQRRSTKDLAVYDPDNDTEFFYLRPRDIAVYVAAGTLDVGITGRDMLLETAPADGEGHGGRRGHAAGLRAAPRSGSPHRSSRASNGSTSSPASGSPRPTRCCCSATSRSRASRPTSSSSTARSRPPAGWASPTRSATSWRPGRRCARPGCTSSASPCSPARRSSSAGRAPRRSPRWPSCGAGCGASWSPAST